MSGVSRYAVREGSDADRLLAALEARESLVRDPTREVTRVVYETFDWRLLGADSILEHRRESSVPATLLWRSCSSGEVLGQLPTDEVPRFVWDLPSSPVVERLAAVTDVRAVVPLATLTSRLDQLRLVDRDGKTMARLVLDTCAVAGGHELPPVVELAPVRGYEAESARLAELLDAQVALVPMDEDLVLGALRAVGFAPGSYSSKLRLQLDPASTALDAWVTVLRALFATIQANESGVRDDVDSEFLHDFRVAVRRTRSVLADAKGILDAETRGWARDEFRWLGQITSPPRDADVFLLTLPDFEASIPPERRPDLKPFAAFLEEQRVDAYRSLLTELDTDRYAQLVQRWRAVLDGGAASSSGEPDAGAPAAQIAGARIRQAHHRVVRDGRAITAASHPEELHELRKEAKRLRYLLECFGSLFPGDLVTPVVRELKGLQDVLGSYQDSQVQAEALGHLGQQMIERHGAPASALLAMGGIVDHLDAAAREAHAGFASRFERFDQKSVRNAVGRIARSA